MNGVQTRFKCKLDVKRCKRFVFPPSSLLPRSNALKTKAIRYFQTDRTLTRIVSPPLQENPGKFKNNQSEYWDGSDVYYTVKAREPYYGETFQWNGVCLLAPYQMGPTLKTLKLKIISNGEAPSFSSAEGELDFSKIDFTRIYKSSTTRVVKENGMDYVEPIAYTEEEASKLKMAYITFRYTSTAGSQEASSSNNRSSAEVPTFKVFAPFLNSSIYIDSGNSSYFYRYYQGYLRKGKDEKTFIIENYSSSYELPEVQVIYEE